MSSVEYLAALAQLQALARGVVAFFAEYDVLLTPALAERPLPIGECNGLGEDPMARLRPLRRTSRPTRRSSTSPASPRSRSRPGSATTACRPTPSSSAKPLGEDTLLQLAAQLEAARPARDGRRPRARSRPTAEAPRTAASARGWTPSASASAVPRGVRIVTASSSASSQVASAVGPGERLVAAQQRAQERRGHREQPAAAVRGAQGELDDLAVRQHVGPRQLVAGVRARRRGRVQRGEHAVGDVLGPDRLRPRPAQPGQRHRRAARPAARAAPAGGRPARRRASGANVVVRRSASSTACSAIALARCRRLGWCGVAPRAEKKTKCSTPACSAARSSRQVAMPASSSIVACGWSRGEAARWTTVRAPRSAWR